MTLERENTSMAIGETIKGLRKQQGMSQATLSKRVGITQASLSDLESGKSKMTSGKNLVKFADALGVDPKTLLRTIESAAPLQIDKPRLIDAVTAVEAALSHSGREVRPRVKAKLISHLYESGTVISEREAARLLELIL